MGGRRGRPPHERFAVLPPESSARRTPADPKHLYAGLVRAISPSRLDAAVAAVFVLAAVVEAVGTHRDTPGLMLLGVTGAPVLAVLAVRRSHPALCLVVISGFAVAGILVQLTYWPDTDDSGGVWIFGMLLACYSLGRHGRGGALTLGALLPLAVVLSADLPEARGWELATGVVFVTVFVGVLPTVVGRLVRLRRERLRMLSEQRELILGEQQARREAAVLAERLRATERLRPALVDGLRNLASQAEAGVEPGALESTARALLTRTRQEVTALTAPLHTAEEPAALPTPDHLGMLRASAQRWAVLGAGIVSAGIALESLHVGSTLPDWLTVLASVVVVLPLAFLPWRPLPALCLLWVAVSAFSRLVAPLGGTLSGAAVAVAAAFAIAALVTRHEAAAGLAMCLVGQTVGVRADDAFGAALLITLTWAGGLAVQEASRLVEQSRANNRLLADQEAVLAQRALVEERFRLAREVHDQLGHSLTVVALQAGAARRLSTTEPERARELLLTIAAAARQGIADVDAVGPAAGSGMAQLLDHTRAAGLAVEADLRDLDALDPAQRAVVFRVVQEALTNVLRHAPGASASVRLQRSGRGPVVLVTNSTPTGTGSGPSGGRGLPGLRERLESAGGLLTWRPLSDGGFEVRAELPGVLEEAGR